MGVLNILARSGCCRALRLLPSTRCHGSEIQRHFGVGLFWQLWTERGAGVVHIVHECVLRLGRSSLHSACATRSTCGADHTALVPSRRVQRIVRSLEQCLRRFAHRRVGLLVRRVRRVAHGEFTRRQPLHSGAREKRRNVHVVTTCTLPLWESPPPGTHHINYALHDAQNALTQCGGAAAKRGLQCALLMVITIWQLRGSLEGRDAREGTTQVRARRTASNGKCGATHPNAADQGA